MLVGNLKQKQKKIQRNRNRRIKIRNERACKANWNKSKRWSNNGSWIDWARNDQETRNDRKIIALG